MRLRKLITENPYRVLGVNVGASVAEELRNQNRILAFSRVGQSAVFKIAGEEGLPVITRDGETATLAASTLSLPADRLKNALVWFSDGTTDWWRMLDRAVSALLDGDIGQAIMNYDKLLSDDGSARDFVEAVTHGMMTVSKERLTDMVCRILTDCCDDIAGYMTSGRPLCRGLLTTALFEANCLDRIEALERSVDVESDEQFYSDFEHLRETMSSLTPLLHALGEVDGKESLRYKFFAEKISISLYRRCVKIIEKVGDWTWSDYRKGKLNANHSFICVVQAMKFIQETYDFAVTTVGGLGLSSDSMEIISPARVMLEGAFGRCHTGSGAEIKKAVSANTKRKTVGVALWLLVLSLIYCLV